MNQQTMTNQPFLNTSAFIRSVAMWVIAWGGTVAFVSYQGQPGILCLTPMAWLLAVPVGLNYVAFSDGKPGRNPFLAGALAGATLGLIFGLLAWGLGSYMMPADPNEVGKLGMRELGLIFTGGGIVIGALLSGMMARFAVARQRRGHTIRAVTVQ